MVAAGPRQSNSRRVGSVVGTSPCVPGAHGPNGQEAGPSLTIAQHGNVRLRFLRYDRLPSSSSLTSRQAGKVCPAKQERYRATLLFRGQEMADKVAEVVDQTPQAVAHTIGVLIAATAGGGQSVYTKIELVELAREAFRFTLNSSSS
jgi:hypothetical protein